MEELSKGRNMPLGPMTTYYVRTRHRSRNGKVSPWATVKQFRTKSELWLETAAINRPGQASSNYGRSVTMSGDGMYLAATDSGKKRYSYVYRKVDVNWILDATLAHPNYNMGYDTDLSYDGSVFVVGGYNIGTRTAVYRKTDNVWSSAYILTSNNYDNHGYSVSLSGDGSTVVASSPTRNSVRVYNWNGSAYTLTATLSRSGVSSLGASCAISKDGSTIVAGSTVAKTAVVFRKVNGTWSYVQSIVSGSSNFGIAVDISDDCERVAVGSTSAKSVYIGLLNPSTSLYSLETTLYSPSNPSEFGRSVAISENGAAVVVGAKGGVSVQRRTDQGWFEQQFLNPSITPNNDDSFGMNVAVDRRNTSAVIGYHASKVFVFSI